LGPIGAERRALSESQKMAWSEAYITVSQTVITNNHFLKLQNSLAANQKIPKIPVTENE